jgi:hypothetical protein
MMERSWRFSLNQDPLLFESAICRLSKRRMKSLASLFARFFSLESSEFRRVKGLPTEQRKLSRLILFACATLLSALFSVNA